jgi:hypothetical protein
MRSKQSNEIVSALCGIALIVAVALSCTSSNSNNNNNSNTRNENEDTENRNSPTPMNQSTPTPTPTPSPSNSYMGNLPAGFRVPTDEVGKRIMSDYGAVYVARGASIPPPAVMFTNESECSSWQSTLRISRAQFGSVQIELQEPAMTALKSAAAEAKSTGLSITPRGGDSARRSYATTVELWQSRVNPGLTYWTGKGRITAQESARIKALTPAAQVPEILRLEEQGIYFSKDFSKSILYSVAAPGTSQHLSMLALDITEFENPSVRALLAQHGWYQTVVSDLPHFTYLGVQETQLPSLGLKPVSNEGRIFWVPAL